MIRFKKYIVFVAVFVCLVNLGAAWAADAPAQSANTALKAEPRPDQWWVDRQKATNERVKQGNVDMIFIGDSITQGWEGEGKDLWASHYAKRNAVNLGFSGDRTQHVLWRLDNGNIDGISPKLAVIMIGTNNCSTNSAEEIAEGVTAIVKKLREKLPAMKILLLGIFPREEKPGEARAKLAKTNEIIAKLGDNKAVFFLDISASFLEPDGALPKSIMPDALHPNAKGYEIWAKGIEPKVKELLGEK